MTAYATGIRQTWAREIGSDIREGGEISLACSW